MNTTTQIEMRPGVARHFRLQWEEAQGAWVLLYPEGMVKLNQSAGEILRLYFITSKRNCKQTFQ